MSRQLTVSEIASRGEASPQEVKAIQARREKQARDLKRGGELAAAIATAASKTNPQRVVAEGEVGEWHKKTEQDFLKVLVHTESPDDILDVETVPVSMARMRKLAREYADLALECAATDTRIANLRREAFEHTSLEVARLREELARVLLGADAQITSVWGKNIEQVRNKVR